MIKNNSPYLAEVLGTFMLVFAGTGAIIVNDVSGGLVSHSGIAATFGLIVLTIIYTYGDISGAHINPAVTIAFWLSGRFSGRQVGPYILAQCIGAILASAALKSLFPEQQSLGSTVPHDGLWQSWILEFLLSWWLMTVILRVSQGSKETGIIAGLVIGAVVGLEALFAGPISGASMNPARSLGPSLLSYQLDTLWIYLTAPTLGTCFAVYTCKWVSEDNCCATPQHTTP